MFTNVIEPSFAFASSSRRFETSSSVFVFAFTHLLNFGARLIHDFSNVAAKEHKENHGKQDIVL